ncbi:RICIN domain-containing protein [Streptomyces hawaiiensis]|uniref:Alpha-glucosidase n=1 Tax=Streptomyces hawaiiensis TaxID=67305 RepID=A0A6G5RQN1_9ACTN|nr:RICIN domain-containing protein [Streptomyces hawaiiensis]QCD60320.1 alpha-glucosidase [Streptomyces hawaiiensis]
MRTSRARKVIVAGAVVGALMAVTSPAIASASPTDRVSAPTPLPLSSLKDRSVAAKTVGLRNVKSGKYLQPTSNSTANGARVVQQPGNDQNSSQHWNMIQDGDLFSFENGRAGKNLGVDGASTQAGAAAIIANPSGDANQDWLIVPTSGDRGALQNRKSHLCLGISGASTTNGAQAAQFACDGSSNQQWQLIVL